MLQVGFLLGDKKGAKWDECHSSDHNLGSISATVLFARNTCNLAYFQLENYVGQMIQCWFHLASVICCSYEVNFFIQVSIQIFSDGMRMVAMWSFV